MPTSRKPQPRYSMTWLDTHPPSGPARSPGGPPSCRWRRAAWVVAAAALAIAGAAPGATAQFLEPSGEPSPTPTELPPTPAARVLVMPTETGPGELRDLAAELSIAAAEQSIVVVRTPVSAELTLPSDDPVFDALADASEEADLAVLMEPGEPQTNGAAAILSAFADARYIRPDVAAPEVDPGNPMWQRAAVLTGCDEGCVRPVPFRSASQLQEELNVSGTTFTPLEGDLGGGTLASVLSEPLSDESDGSSPWMPLLVAGLVAALGTAALFFARRRGGQPMPVPQPRSVGPGEAAMPPPPRRPRIAQPPPRRRGTGQPGVVRSALHPDGYVELDGRLVRVRWADPSGTPAPPGEWVDIEEHRNRLWAFPAGVATPRR
jgi:hypothetical protein